MTIQDEVFPRLSAIQRSDEVWHRGLRCEDLVVFAAHIKVLCNIVHDLGRIPRRILARNTNHLLYKPDNVALSAGQTLLQIGMGLWRHMGPSAILRLVHNPGCKAAQIAAGKGTMLCYSYCSDWLPLLG